MAPQDSRPTLLIVDDEPANLAILTAVLAPSYLVRAVRSGRSTLRAVAVAPLPDLILLDIMMPEMDGYSVLEHLKQDPLSRDIPVIFISALNAMEDEERGLALGAVDYIGKPIRPAIVLARVHAQLELKKARDLLKRRNTDLEAEVNRRLEENREIELQLLQSEKMAAIGLLAAGIAHEVNSPIGYVTANLEALERYGRDIFEVLDAYRALRVADPPGMTAREALRALETGKDMEYLRADLGHLIEESREGLKRATDIIQDLKMFSRREESDWQWADPHLGLESTLRIVWNELKYNCTVVKEYGELPLIHCMPSQLNQVFMNLLVNASQAIEGKGAITIRTGRRESEVWIEIADTGTGIATQDLKRIFEPFYTTKPVGKGTGLGLSLSASIVAKHTGRIEVASAPGKGTTFRVILPVDPAASGTATEGASEPDPGQAPRSG